LRKLPGEHHRRLQPHRATIEPARAVEAAHQIGGQREQRAHDHHREGEIEIRRRAKSQRVRRANNAHCGQQHGNEQGCQHEIDSQHGAVEAGGPAVAVDAQLERQEAVDRTQLKARVRDQNEIARRIKRKPGGKRVAGPKMQENRDQRDLLRNSQQ
jgi:hypothetical protein